MPTTTTRSTSSSSRSSRPATKGQWYASKSNLPLPPLVCSFCGELYCYAAATLSGALLPRVPTLFCPALGAFQNISAIVENIFESVRTTAEIFFVFATPICPKIASVRAANGRFLHISAQFHCNRSKNADIYAKQTPRECLYATAKDVVLTSEATHDAFARQYFPFSTSFYTENMQQEPTSTPWHPICQANSANCLRICSKVVKCFFFRYFCPLFIAVFTFFCTFAK